MYLILGFEGYTAPINWETIDAVDFSTGLPDSWDGLFIKDHLFDYKSKRWLDRYDVLFIGDENQGAANGIVGLIIKQMNCDSAIMRALALLDSRFLESGKWDIPLEQPSEWERRESPNIPDRLWYPSILEVRSMWPIHETVARFVFRKVGIEAPELKAMLVWTWS
jgi:hypothetical protein